MDPANFASCHDGTCSTLARTLAAHPGCMSSEGTSLAKKPGQVVDKAGNAKQHINLATHTHVGPVHVPTSVFPSVIIAPTMAELVAVVAVLEILHAVIEALHTAKTNVSAGAGPTAS
jgi:hypothetical protein